MFCVNKMPKRKIEVVQNSFFSELGLQCNDYNFFETFSLGPSGHDVHDLENYSLKFYQPSPLSFKRLIFHTALQPGEE